MIIKELIELLKLIGQEEKGWALRLDTEVQSKLSFYNIHLGIEVVKAEKIYNQLFAEIRGQEKHAATAEIKAKATNEYYNYQMLKKLYETTNGFIIQLRSEVKHNLTI